MLELIVSAFFVAAIGIVAYFYQRHKKKTDIASVLIGEITSIINTGSERNYLEGLKQTLKDQEAEPPNGKIHFFFFSINEPYFPIYEQYRGDMGLFPYLLPEDLSRFYSKANSVIVDIKDMEEENAGRKEMMRREDNERRLRQCIAFIEDCRALAVQIIIKLQAIRDSRF